MVNQSLFIQLEPRSISACVSLPHELSFLGSALQHQVEVFEQSRHADIILDLAPTGTGKTKAGLTVLLHHPRQNAIYIAPTNALVEQQTEAAEKFVKDAGLPHVVKTASARSIKDWPEEKVGKRSGEKLYNFLRNPATIFPEVGANRPVLLVTNPDIFYYATFFAYNNLDRDNIASSFYAQFATVIFDEFHLYDAKQLVGLLFYLAYYHIFGFFRHGRKVVLLTATPEPACEAALESLANQGVKVVRIHGESKDSYLLPSQTAVNLELRPVLQRDNLLQEIGNEILGRWRKKPTENGAVILDSKDNINRLADLLKTKGLEGKFGRITGSTPIAERKLAAQKPIILATSTVDVGFNFERNENTKRQNLDWLIFSARDRAAFWQRIGRVGRVLGKQETNVPSWAIAYLPEKAWEEGLSSLDTTGGRTALKESLQKLSCLDKPFLTAYWRSEAFLEIARPLLKLEKQLKGLSGSEYIPQLFNSLRTIFGGKRDWKYYRQRMMTLTGAENISQKTIAELQNKWKFLPGGQAFVKTYLRTKYPEDWEDIQAQRTTLDEYDKLFQNNPEIVADLKEFAEIWQASYSSLFQFRNSLFTGLEISDPHGLLLDELDETTIDPIHLLRYYEFEKKDKIIEIKSRAQDIYQISFYLRYHDTYQDFFQNHINKLTAFKNIQIKRKLEGAVRPTPLLQELEKKFLSGVIICPIKNAKILLQLQKEGISSYPITIECNDARKEYVILPGLSGIMAVAMQFNQIKLPDGELFIT